MFWAALKSFDRCLGRMPETSELEQDPLRDTKKRELFKERP
jgi:hypothetical protein